MYIPLKVFLPFRGGPAKRERGFQLSEILFNKQAWHSSALKAARPLFILLQYQRYLIPERNPVFSYKIVVDYYRNNKNCHRGHCHPDEIRNDAYDMLDP